VAAFGLFVWLDWAWPEGYVYAAVGVGIVAVCMSEYEQLIGRLGIRPARAALVYGGAALFLLQWAGWATPAFPEPWLSAVGVIALVAMGLLTERVLRAQVDGALEEAAAHALGLLYVPVLLGFLTAVRMQWGVAGLILVVAVGKSGSSGAYFIGKNFGRIRITPAVSPRKTLEGVFGAFAGAMLVSLALSVSPWALMGPGAALLYGALAAAAGIMGDLAESLLKREAGMKDSGRVLPGLGGMLDIVDDMLFVAPVSFVFLRVYAVLCHGG
jgi:phosphatidate cytidylyltransferase